MDRANNNLISVSNVTKNFELTNRTVKVLKNVSFNIPDGSFTIIHGPSGSGKTTLLNTITGIDQPTEGSVQFYDKNIYELSEAELAHFRAQTMGIVYQANYWVRSLSVLENVALPLYFLGYDRANAEREARESLKRVAMDEHCDTLPNLLSGGEQQRVAIARALVSNPSYIVADEPTGNLDSKNGNDIIDLLHYFHEKLERTIILVTHNQNYLKYGTQLLEVKDGVVTETIPDKKLTGLNKTRANHNPVTSTINKLKPIRTSMLVHVAFANLKFKRLRSGLTIMGVTLGIGAIFSLLSFGLGLQHLVQKQIIGTDSVRVINITTPNSEVLKLDQSSIQRFQEISNVEKIGKQYTSAGEIKLNSASSDAVIYGIDKSYMDLSNLTILAGQPLNPDSSQDLLINKSLLNALGQTDPSKAIGNKISLTLKLDSGDKDIKQLFNVTGVIESGSGTAIYIPQNIYKSVGETEYKQVKVVTQNENDVPSVRQQIELFGYQTTSPLDTLEQVNRFFRFFNVILIGFGGIGMIIAVIGMLNTLTIALLERTKEIGLMIALGARRRDMRRLFIAESLLLSAIGGSIGVVGSIILGLTINLVANQMSEQRGIIDNFSLFAVPAWLVLLTISFMCAVGYLVAYLPARRAERINPIDALRNE